MGDALFPAAVFSLPVISRQLFLRQNRPVRSVKFDTHRINILPPFAGPLWHMSVRILGSHSVFSPFLQTKRIDVSARTCYNLRNTCWVNAAYIIKTPKKENAET